MRVLPPVKEHKFCWFNGDAADYEKQIKGSKITNTDCFGFFVEIAFENGKKLCVNDGVNIRIASAGSTPKNYQLLIEFDDGSMLVFTVAMYGGIFLHNGAYENEYYLKSKAYVSPFSPEFAKLYSDTLNVCKPTLSAKAFLATEQRFPGIGNGVLQDILFTAGIHPKRKLETLNNEERITLLESTISVLREMTDKGGRDTEKDIYGLPGGYRTKMSKNTFTDSCPVCGEAITKEAYLGGSVYYCPYCQQFKK